MGVFMVFDGVGKPLLELQSETCQQIGRYPSALIVVSASAHGLMTSHAGLCLGLVQYTTLARLGFQPESVRMTGQRLFAIEIVPTCLVDWLFPTGYAVSIPCGYTQATTTAGQLSINRSLKPTLDRP